MLVGAGMTFIVQSSSVFTSAITPLVGQYRNPVDWIAYQTVESLVTITADIDTCCVSFYGGFACLALLEKAIPECPTDSVIM